MKIWDALRFACGTAFVCVLAMPAYSSAERGKALYNESCVHCHGAAGGGNTVQDRFWKMRIPRLSEAYVQRKPDAELSNIILNGKRKMPPAMLGQPEIEHKTKITAEQVPDLIEYVRSLRKK